MKPYVLSAFVFRVQSAKVKSVKLTLCIIFYYVVSSTPFVFVQLVYSLGNMKTVGRYLEPLFWLMTLNSLVNPWVYMGFNRGQLNRRTQSTTSKQTRVEQGN